MDKEVSVRPFKNNSRKQLHQAEDSVIASDEYMLMPRGPASLQIALLLS
jgi:hypothetical protein